MELKPECANMFELQAGQASYALQPPGTSMMKNLHGMYDKIMNEHNIENEDAHLVMTDTKMLLQVGSANDGTSSDTRPPSTSHLVKIKPLLGPRQSTTVCPFCLHCVITKIDYTTTTRTHFLALKCFICCLCCVPYCMTSARNTDHFCPNCDKYVGTYKK